MCRYSNTNIFVCVDLKVTAESLEMTGRTFSANRANGNFFSLPIILLIHLHCCLITIIGMLQINTMGGSNQTGENLQNDQLATLVFPSGIDLISLIGNSTDDEEDIRVIFVVYDQNNLFPVREPVTDGNRAREDNEIETVVGSPVISLTIAGLLPGTILPEPIEIVLRIVETGVQCSFYND